MKTNKSYKEAILRAYPSEKDDTQDQERLLSLKQQPKATAPALKPGQSPVVETHKNIMRSWLNLRGLDQNLAENSGEEQGEAEK